MSAGGADQNVKGNDHAFLYPWFQDVASGFSKPETPRLIFTAGCVGTSTWPARTSEVDPPALGCVATQAPLTAAFPCRCLGERSSRDSRRHGAGTRDPGSVVALRGVRGKSQSRRLPQGCAKIPELDEPVARAAAASLRNYQASQFCLARAGHARGCGSTRWSRDRIEKASCARPVDSLGPCVRWRTRAENGHAPASCAISLLGGMCGAND
jgi:hypothetical protein